LLHRRKTRLYGRALASVHPETVSFWNRWRNTEFWGARPGGFG
jgi:hypothetical protein